MKLYRVTLRGMKSSIGGNTCTGISYVATNGADKAYSLVKRYVDEHNLGFVHERELEKIELLAETTDYPDCGMRLFIEQEK